MRLKNLRWTGTARSVVYCGIISALWLMGCSSSGETTNSRGVGGSGGNLGGAAGGSSAGDRTSGDGGTSDSRSSSVTGGTSGVGGTTAAGGATNTAGKSATGGAENSGGVSANASSGVGGAVTGGMSSTGSKTSGGTGPGGRSGGGTSSSNGTTAGGVTGTGGRAAGGNANGGSSSTGGASSVGGSTASAVCIAATAVGSMRIGWNLGNSLDSADTSKSDTAVETAWGNPVVTPALIHAVASAGFGVVRIPVTWIGRFGAAPDYTISTTYIARVEEVVNYVLDEGLYAIINLHHDGGEGVTGQWIKLVDSAGRVTSANTTQVLSQFQKIWAQIATRFKGYGDHLIFESMNEIKVGYDAPLQSYYDQVNGLNQAFVDTIRATGGNNSTRCLVVPGYNTNIDYTVTGFVAPTDTSSSKLILSDHFYDPWTFAGSGATHTWGMGNANIDNWGQEDWIVAEVAKLKSNYIDKGLPVIWGEYGAVNQAGYENYRRYYMEYVTKVTHDAGIVPVFWDIGSTSSGDNAFGLINRSSNTVQYAPILDAMMRAVTSNYTLSHVAKP